jgi:HlyD family secretion protein
MSETLAEPIHAPLLTRRRTWLIAAGAVVLVALVAAPFLRRDNRVQYLGAKVQQGEIKDAVEATGIVNAVVNVQVGSQVSGTIAKLNADFNSRVHKGDVIALIDPQLLQGALLQASADLENAKANVVAARANLDKAKAMLVQTRADFDRATALEDKGIGTQQALDLAKANYQSAKAAVDAAVASVTQANAQVSQKDAAVAVARTNLNYTVIRSPIDGTVVARNVDVGQTVAASLQAPTVFTIAQDLAKMQVYAKVDESDVGRIGTGHQVTFKVDAFPKDVFKGTVTQIRMNPTSVQNVVTYDAIIDFANPELKLFPGMTAYVTIPVATVENVVKLPNAALRFKPPLSPETVRALYARYGIDTAKQPDAGAGSNGSNGSTAAPSTRTGARRSREESAVVWKPLADGSIEPIEVALGITDHAFTEVTRVITGSLQPGDEVVTSSVTSKALPPGAQGIRR